MNVVDLLLPHAARGDRVALIAGERIVSYAELVELIDEVSRALQGSGILRHGDGVPRVGLACPNGVEYVVLALGVLRAGGCLVPIASELAPRERSALLRSIAPDAVIVAPGFSWSDAASIKGTATLDVRGIAANLLSTCDDAALTGFDPRALAALDPAFVRFSSGTTGSSKGVVLSHAALQARIAAANRALAIGPQDRVLWMLPMAHHFAVSVLLYLAHGASTVLIGSHLAADVLAAARRYHGTLLYASPFHYGLLASEPSGTRWPELRLALSTTAPLPLETAHGFAARYDAPLCQALGIIEVGLPTVNLAAAADKPESVGRAIPDFALELRDAQGRPVATGEVGELHLRGPGMLDAYLDPFRSREEVLPDGWFATGDLGMLDADGDLRLVGRTRSAINVAGMKCFPEEIEAVLREHADVREVRVRARAHPRVGAVPIAEIVPVDANRAPSARSLTAHCRRALARFKVPVEFRMVDSLPRTASGKLQR
jgi:long-chain acyl-CoA synthetase